MCLFFSEFILNSCCCQPIVVNRPRSVSNFIARQDYSDMYHFASRIWKKGQVARPSCFKVGFLPDFDLLSGIARQLEATHGINHLRKARAINAAKAFSAPQIRRSQIFRRYPYQVTWRHGLLQNMVIGFQADLIRDEKVLGLKIFEQISKAIQNDPVLKEKLAQKVAQLTKK